MASFRFRGRDRNGNLTSGELEAASSNAAATQLSVQGITPIAIDEVKESSALQLPNWLKQEKVRDVDLVMFARQMYTVTKTGIPLIASLHSLADSLHNKPLREAIIDCAERLETGIELSVAMNFHPKVFNPLFINIVRVGEDSGRLDEAFLQLAEYLERDLETRRGIKSALRYPSFVLIALVIAVTVINLFVIPNFSQLFKSMHADLPLPTMILIGVSNFFVGYWPYLLVATLLTWIGVSRYLKTEQGALSWGQNKLKLPIVGDLINRATLARYTRSLSLMLKSGVPLPNTLELCARVIDNPFLAKKIRTIRSSIERGENLYQTHHRSGLFTPLVLQMIAVGEVSGQVDTLLGEVADYYEREVDYDLKSLSARIEPIVIVILAVMVMILALGIFLPIWQMYELQLA